MNHLGKWVIVVAGLIASSVVSTNSFADAILDKLKFGTSAEFQYKSLSFDQTFPTGLGNAYVTPLEGGIEVQIPMIAIGFSASYDSKVFFGLKFAESLANPSDKSDVPFTNPIAPSNVQNSAGTYQTNSEVSRKDFSVSVGYNIWRTFNVFAGYLQGETEITPSPFRTPGSNGIDNLAQIQLANYGDDYIQTYSEDGFFVGAMYIYPIRNLGSFSFSLAYASMDGQYEDNFRDLRFDFEGDATGTNIGIIWASRLTQTISYSIGIRLESYELDGSDSTGSFSGNTVTTEEKMNTFTAALKWRI